MKKILLAIGLAAVTVLPALSKDCSTFQCPANPYKDKITISNVTGVNFLSEKIVNSILAKEIKKDSGGKYKVDLQSYNVSALKSGEFKSLEITGQNIVSNGIYASDIRLKTICDYNHIEIDNIEDTITFKEDFGMTYTVTFSEEDLNKTMSGQRYGEMIRKVNNIGNSYKLFNIVSSSSEISDNKLYYIMNVAVPILNIKKDIVVELDMKVVNGELILDEAQLITENMNMDISKLTNLINQLNPLEFSLKLFNNKYANMNIKELGIKNNQINVSGILTVDKDVEVPQ